MIRVRLLGGPYDGSTAELIRTPQAIVIDGQRYEAILDPDHDEFLGGYVWQGPQE